MHLLEIALLDAGAAGKARLLGRRCARPGEAVKPPLGLADHVLVANRAGGRDHHAGRPVVAGQIGAQALGVERAHGRARAENGTADRLARKGGRLEMFEHEIVRRVFHGPDLLDDDILLARDLVGIEARMGEDVGEDVEA